jgi:hypothetical protein
MVKIINKIIAILIKIFYKIKDILYHKIKKYYSKIKK